MSKTRKVMNRPHDVVAKMTVTVLYWEPSPGQTTSKVRLEVVSDPPVDDVDLVNHVTVWGTGEDEPIGAELRRCVEPEIVDALRLWCDHAEKRQRSNDALRGTP